MEAIEDMKKELADLLDKRAKINEKMMARFHDGSATRARTTTSNAESTRVNERIFSIREDIKRREKDKA